MPDLNFRKRYWVVLEGVNIPLHQSVVSTHRKLAVTQADAMKRNREAHKLNIRARYGVVDKPAGEL